ncbi:MAG: hypothetical protein NTZ48_06460 [Candidatus Omnitrophica bacterium]|nr:hypothetical protein [Candidatus Omnitrophota bacterium]
MPKINIDDNKSLYEPIEITLEGKTYVIEKITKEALDQIAEEKTDALKQFAILTGANVEDLKKVDIRKIGHALKFIQEKITASLEIDKKNL